MASIEVADIIKTFTAKTGPPFRKTKKTLRAVDGVSFAIERGEIFSLLGPNGAGKTTTIKILATLLIPTSGIALVSGFDVVKNDFQVRKVLTAVLPGERTLYWKLTVKENLRYFGSLYGLSRKEMKPRIEKLLNDFELADKEDTLVEKLSTGQRQKAVLCRAMLPEPEVLLLDEPTLGLDPVAGKHLRELIRKIRERGTTILLTTHYMYEADELSDRVAIIDNGRIVCLDTPEKLKRELNVKRIFRMETDRWDNTVSTRFLEANGASHATFYRKNGHFSVEIEVARDNLNLESVSSFCAEVGIHVLKVSIDEPTLEDVFVEKTGRKIAEGEKRESAVLA
jgi:ABC-2 type transport system ATP-binding protein